MEPLRCFLYKGIQKSKGAGTLEGSRCFADALSVHAAENAYRTVLGEYGIKAGSSCLQKLLFIGGDAAAGRSLGRTAVFCNDCDPVLFDGNLYMINECIGGQRFFQDQCCDRETGGIILYKAGMAVNVANACMAGNPLNALLLIGKTNSHNDQPPFHIHILCRVRDRQTCEDTDLPARNQCSEAVIVRNVQ